jgi:hypothetical protein
MTLPPEAFAQVPGWLAILYLLAKEVLSGGRTTRRLHARIDRVEKLVRRRRRPPAAGESDGK